MNMKLLAGTAAHSQFRLDALRLALSSAMENPTIEATWVYALQFEGEGPDAETLSKAATLLNAVADEQPLTPGSFYVTPRKGTISPWSSKATDIFRNCGLKGIARVERGIRYTLMVDGQALSPINPAALLPLFDKMTEGLYTQLDDLFDCPPPRSGRTYDVMTKGIEAIPSRWERGCRYFKVVSPTGEQIEINQDL